MEQTRTDKHNHTTREGGEVKTLMKRLGDLKNEDADWEYRADVDETGTLTRLWWMSPYQRTLAKFHGEVLILDVSEGRNMYDFYLTTFVVVDAENNTRNIAYCISESQDGETFEWMFRHLNHYLPASFVAVFSDRDGAIANAIESVWPNVFHGICLWHLHKCIVTNLAAKMGGRFKSFMWDFWKVYRQGSPAAFVHEWGNMIRRWPESADYLLTYIWPDREKWAWAWVGMRFLAGIRTTGRVESEHKQHKSAGLGRRSTITEVFEILNIRTSEQKDKELAGRYQVGGQKCQITDDSLLKRGILFQGVLEPSFVLFWLSVVSVYRFTPIM